MGPYAKKHGELLQNIVFIHGWPRMPKFNDAADNAARHILEVAVPSGRVRTVLELCRDEGPPPVTVLPLDRSHEGQGVQSPANVTVERGA